jgi:AhpD family alkylhydroperoxidase
MKPRLNPYVAAAKIVQPLIDFGKSIDVSGLEPTLVELVKIRASQINGCAMCLHMHAKAALKVGETEERIFLLDAWRDSPLFNDRERAALRWTEALTRLSETHAPDEDYEAVAAEFPGEEIVRLTMIIVAINGFNRLGVGFGVRHPTSERSKAA